MNIKEFFQEWKQFGFKVAFNNFVLMKVIDFLRIKRLKISYKK